MKKILLLSTLLTLLSCGSTASIIEYNKRYYNDIPLNKEISNEIGDRLITKGQEFYQKALRITSTPEFNINTFEFPYSQGDILPLSAETSKWYLYYLPNKSSIRYETIGIGINKTSGEIKPYLKTSTSFFDKNVRGFETSEATYTDKKCEDCYKQEFIYNGKVNNSLKFIYREFINDLARPSFTQELQYDLNESKTIGFKGMRLDVIEASNTKITYILKNTFTHI